MATDNKYDRQLRLWGAHGQRRLMEAHIVVLGASPVATETLKNLALPGIGKFTIVDGETVSDRDLGNNFFVTADDRGSSRAEAVKNWIMELNPDVKGEAVSEKPEKLIDEQPDFFKSFTLVIGTQLREDYAKKLSEICGQHKIEMMLVRTYGLSGYLRTYVQEHNVIESKPQDKVIDDLRLAEPFPELLEFAKSFDMVNLADHLHSHIPYACILIQLMQQWMAEHDGKRPQNTTEKDEFRAKIKAAARNYFKDGNFQEANDNAYKAFNTPEVPYEVQLVLDDEKAANPQAGQEDFWFLAGAIKKFVSNEGNGNLPLIGTIPDMTADTDSYIKLQKIYNEKSSADFAAARAHLDGLLQAAGRKPEDISEDAFTLFCKNVYTLESNRMRSVETEINTPNTDDIMTEFFDDESLIEWYFALRACDRFCIETGKFPGEEEDFDSEELLGKLKGHVQTLHKEAKVEESAKINEDILKEFARYGACEIHNIAAFMGGVGAQEGIKLVTKQYTLANNTLMYSGVHARLQVLEL